MDEIDVKSVYDGESAFEEKDKIQQLRERIQPFLTTSDQNDDEFLKRWLIARRFDVDKAEDMLKKHLRFKKLYELDKYLEYKPPEVVKYFFTTKLGYDKEGSVVRLLNVGASDIRGLCCSLSKDDSIRYANYLLKMDQISQKKDCANTTYSTKQVYIMDLQGLSWRAIVQRTVVNRAFLLLRCYEANHPECLKVAYLINVPSFFSVVYNWLKTVLPESIISKLEIVTQDDCEAVLTKSIDPSILPASIGGTRRDPDGDPTCQSLYAETLGTPVPEDLISADMESLKKDPDAKRITVDYKSFYIVEKEVSEPNSVLQWDFQTVDYDIRVGLRYKQNENEDSEEIIPPHRVDSHIMPESGNLTCEKPGIYELIFDNTYSWMTRKEVIFKVNLIPPRKEVEN